MFKTKIMKETLLYKKSDVLMLTDARLKTYILDASWYWQYALLCYVWIGMARTELVLVED